jgi:LAO/AO transport system kinase
MSSETVRKRLSLQSYVDGILSHDRVVLSKAITLVESNLPADIELAESLIRELLPHTGRSQRVGITGVPGVGKSTFIEAFGLYLIGLSKSVAVLTIDPSSQRSKGSILGDKTRMEKLSNHEKAFVRPSASGTSLGGVNARTREAMLLCEAFGFDIIIIETVGVGQNETTLRGIVDFFLLLMLAGAGDELQGIKRGIMEMADAIAINKADGDNVQRSELAKREYEGALHLFPPSESGWIPKVVTCSSVEGTGLETIYELVCEHEWQTKSTGHFEKFRLQQNLNWMWETVMNQLQSNFHNNSRVKEAIPLLQKKVENGELPPMTAARELMALFNKGK